NTFEALPVVLRRNAHVTVVRRFGILIGHLQEDQVSELLQVIAIADTVVTQGGTETPYFGDDRGTGRAHSAESFLVLSCKGESLSEVTSIFLTNLSKSLSYRRS